MISIEISRKSDVFHEIEFPEKDFGQIVGYTALTAHYGLPIPMPKRISLISPKNRRVKTNQYQLYPSTYLPGENLFDQLTFALKYEGINLLVLKKIFEKIGIEEITTIATSSNGIYARKIWYLYEWLISRRLGIPDANTQINYALLANPKIQYTTNNKNIQVKSERHRITNNLLGTIDFCPHVYKTDKLDNYQKKGLQLEQNQFNNQFNKTILLRASAYLMLEDSKSSFAIEGEKPKSNRLTGWAQAIGQAGKNQLTNTELLRLQQIVLPQNSKIDFGYRKQGGFIGDYEEDTNKPRPVHISAKWQDLDHLMKGLIDTNENLIEDDIDAVVVAALISFGFVFIHPFIDGNGRIHRYLIHHILARKKFTPEGIIFPVSASIEKHITKYSKALERYSSPLLNYMKWETTKDKNVEVTNTTIDYYRYFDATHLVEYLYACIEETIKIIIPHEINMLRKFDEFKSTIEEEIGLPDNKIKLLANLLIQNDGKLSKIKRAKLFDNLSDNEQQQIETAYKEIYLES